MSETSREHWEKIYDTKSPAEVSWTQSVPKTSLDFIRSFRVPKSAPIIDVGGGDSTLVDYLLEAGYEKITVLDISEKAILRAKKRLGSRADKVNWITSDVVDFKPRQQYAVWHDRAAFHFLTTEAHIRQYLDTARGCVNGYLTIGTFSETGPRKCSGLTIRQYSEESLTRELSKGFSKLKCITEDHITPFSTVQNFLFCSFKRL